MQVAFGRIRRRIALLRTCLLVVVRFIARFEITELNKLIFIKTHLPDLEISV